MTNYHSQFRGDLAFLSNMYPCHFIIDDIDYPSVEHYFQSMKTSNVEEKKSIIEVESPVEAKKLGKKVTLRKDWEAIKDIVMFDGVLAKFKQNEKLENKLIHIDDSLLIEKNSWGDRYWGVDYNTGIGLNKLGKILKKVKMLLILSKNKK